MGKFWELWGNRKERGIGREEGSKECFVLNSDFDVFIEPEKSQ